MYKYILLLTILLSGCGFKEIPPKFYPGDSVVFKINNQSGQILYSIWWNGRYEYDIRTVDSFGNITTITDVVEYELK